MRRWLIPGGAVLAIVVLVVLWRLTGVHRDTPAAAGAGAGSGSGAVGSSATLATGTSGPQLPTAGSAAGSGSPAPSRGPDGIGMGAPRSLATIPAAYTLADIGAGHVGVNLAGGAPTIYVPSRDTPDPPMHEVRGRVLDMNGKPVAGAIVLASADQLGIMAGNLSANAGAVTDASGAFTLKTVPVGNTLAIAFDPTGWSELVSVGDAPLELHLRGRGALRGKMTYNNHGESFELYLQSQKPPGLLVAYETDSDGTFLIASLPPGDYKLLAGLAQHIGGGTSRNEERIITITAGQTTEIEIKQSSGTDVVLSAHVDPAPDTYEYWLFTGTTPPDLPTARARAKTEHARGGLHGGNDLDTPMQVHDVAAGTYQACAATDTGWFGCTQVIVLDGDDVREVTIKLAH
jgi:hypothetical protein